MPKPVPTGELNYLKKEDYGMVPEYLSKVRQRRIRCERRHKPHPPQAVTADAVPHFSSTRILNPHPRLMLMLLRLRP